MSVLYQNRGYYEIHPLRIQDFPAPFDISLGSQENFRASGMDFSRFGGPGAQIHPFRMFIMIWQRAIRIGQIHFRPLLNKNQVNIKVPFLKSIMLVVWTCRSGIVPKCLSLSPTKKVFSRVFSIIVSTHRLLSLAGYVGMSGQERLVICPPTLSAAGRPQVSHLKPTKGLISVSKLPGI